MNILLIDFENWLKDTDRWDYHRSDYRALKNMYDTLFEISEICVEESKWHIKPKDAIRKIRKKLNKWY